MFNEYAGTTEMGYFEISLTVKLVWPPTFFIFCVYTRFSNDLLEMLG